MVAEMKLCIDCKWYGGVAAKNGEYICHEPRNVFTHPVDGLPLHKYDAFSLRKFNSGNFCGPDGEWWVKIRPPSSPDAGPPRGP
jgi:hypothetical protein